MQPDISAETAYGLFRDGLYEAALIEIAQIVGIERPDNLAVGVEERSTYGVGELIRLLLDEGIRHFYIALGGSATNDGGAGLLAALGVRFIGMFRRTIEPTPAGLAKLISVDVTALDARLADCQIRLLTDVNNPLLGPQGATAVFGPQKGVRAEQVAQLDQVLAHYAERLEAAMQKQARDRPGTGAAGGLGFALQLLGGQFEAGAETVARLIGLAEASRAADWLLTGEGRSDRQTLFGKTPLAAARAFRQTASAEARVTLLSGSLDLAAAAELNQLFDGGCFSIVTGPMSLAEAVAAAPQLLEHTSAQITRAIRPVRCARKAPG
jgi:glycerate kinase